MMWYLHAIKIFKTIPLPVDKRQLWIYCTRKSFRNLLYEIIQHKYSIHWHTTSFLTKLEHNNYHRIKQCNKLVTLPVNWLSFVKLNVFQKQGFFRKGCKLLIPKKIIKDKIEIKYNYWQFVYILKAEKVKRHC